MARSKESKNYSYLQSGLRYRAPRGGQWSITSVYQESLNMTGGHNLITKGPTPKHHHFGDVGCTVIVGHTVSLFH